MALARATAITLLVGFVATFSALAIGRSFGRTPPREKVAPEAWAALERRDPERAAALFRQELKQRPQDPMLHFGAGSAAYALGRTGPALTSFKKAVEIDPEFAEALAMLARVAYDRGDNRLAVRSIDKASALRPRDADLAELRDRWRRESSVHDSYVEKPVEHFRILFEGGTQRTIGDRVAHVLEREYTRIGRALNTAPAEPITVVLYGNREFHDITRSPSWATGNYDGRIRIAVGGAVPSYDLDRLVTHELVHAFVASAAPRRVPAWLNEGLASYLESSDHRWAEDTVRRVGSPVPLETLASGFSGLDEQGALVAYAESAIAAEILCTQLGSNIGAFLKVIGNGNTLDQALLEFHVQPNAFHAEWRRRVGLQ